MIFIEKLYLVKKLYLSNSISSYFLASRSRTRVREFGRELSYKGDVMVRQRFTALCKTAMVSSIMDSPSNLYKVLTVSTEFVANFWKWSQYSTDHIKCIVNFFWKFLVKVIDPAKFWLSKAFSHVKYIWIFSKNMFHWRILETFGKNFFWYLHFLKMTYFLRCFCQLVVLVGLKTLTKDVQKSFQCTFFVVSEVLPSFRKVCIKFRWHGQKLTYNDHHRIWCSLQNLSRRLLLNLVWTNNKQFRK